MAEAHQAVSYSELIKHEPTNKYHQLEVLMLVWQSGVRSWKKRIGRFKSEVKNGVYPAHIETLWILIGVTTAIHFSGKSIPFDLVNTFLKIAPEASLGWTAAACGLSGFVFWVSICLIMRYTLKLLLMYKGFMFESRGKRISKTTMIWGILVKFFVKWNKPSLYSFQTSLPNLPLPSVKDTMKRYLRSVRPLLDDENYERVVKQSKEFESGIGKKLQRYLVLKSWWASNYVSDWWEEYVYLRGRSPLMVNSNYYCADNFGFPTTIQAARAANMTYFMMQFRKRLDRQEIKPIMAQGLVPLCSWQYERMFNTTRVPGVETDTIVHYKDSNHIAVLHKGCYYKMIICHNGCLLNAKEIQYQYEQILKMNDKTSHGETYLASLTAWNRTKWANARSNYFTSGINKASLEVIESAAFLTILDDRTYTFGLNSTQEEYDKYSAICLHGRVYDRWFDKNFQMSISTNGIFAMNVEHTWADAPTLAHCFEDASYDELNGYDENGNVKGTMREKPPLPTRLSWEFSDQLVKTIDEAYSDGLKVINDVDHKLVVHDSFGKGFIKTCKLSPDAFVQMSLQLAYFRDYGKFSLTYEASMTRFFREGRTETVRPCTIESSAFVRAMDDKNSSTAERVKLLNEACNRHQQGYLDAMCGRGIDRHLFCLYVVSKYLEVESPFLKEMISEPWRLSTSQTPHGQTPKINISKIPGLATPGGGFGAASHDGYGVSYIISGENKIWFHLSSFKSCEKTDTTRFVKRIFTAMNDIKLLFEDYKKTSK